MRVAPLMVVLSLAAGCSCSAGGPGEDTEEVPYDGIDQDGDGEDLLDVDGDGYAGVAADDYDGEWPEGMSTEVDCDDEDTTIHPNSNFELPYDGIDSDCDGVDDYDFDGDGYVPDGYADDSDLPGGDCDDADEDVNPRVSASDDDPYDGVDANCDCANDFDVDGDTYSPNQSVNAAAFASFNLSYGCDLTAAWGDCDDHDGTVNPGATEVWYDGADTDCDGADDYDQDGDGYAPDTYASDSSLPAGDCDDTDPDLYPGAVEIWGDGTDQNCDGDDLLGTLQPLGEYDWVNPRTPHVLISNERIIGVFSAEEWTDLSTVPATTQTWPGLFAHLDPMGHEWVDRWNWNGSANADPLGDSFDAAADADGNVYISFGMQRVVSSGSNMYLSLRPFQRTGTGYMALSPTLQGLESELFPADVDIQVDGDEVFLASCSGEYLQFAHASWASGSFSRREVGKREDASGSACVLDLSAGATAADAILYVQGVALDPKPYQLSDGTDDFVDLDPGDTLTGPYEDVELLLVNEDEGLVTYYDGVSGNSYIDGDFGTELLFVATEVVELSATEDPGTGDIYVAAVTEDRGTDGIPDLVILYGPPDALGEIEVDLDGATPHGAGIEATEDELVLAVATRDPNSDAGDILWMYVELP